MDKTQNKCSPPQTAGGMLIENELSQPGKSVKSERSASIDVMRGISMIFVIAAHMPLTQKILGYDALMIFAYVVPLYFMISGYLLASSAAKTGFPRYLWNRVTGLLFPYIFFFFFSFLWTNTIWPLSFGKPMFHETLSWLDLLKSFAFAGKSLFDSAVISPPLWFLHALFFTSIPFYFIAKIKNKYVVMVIAFILLVAALPVKLAFEQTPYWILAMFPATLFFMAFGCLLRLYSGWLTTLKNKLTEKYKIKDAAPIFNSFLAIALIIATFFLMQLGRGNIWDYTSDWYFLAALVFSLAIFILSRETKNRVLIYIGRNSLYFLALHDLVMKVSWIANLPETFINHGFGEQAAYICYFLITLLAVSVFVFVVVFLKKLFKILYRRIKASKKKMSKKASAANGSV